MELLKKYWYWLIIPCVLFWFNRPRSIRYQKMQHIRYAKKRYGPAWKDAVFKYDTENWFH